MPQLTVNDLIPPELKAHYQLHPEDFIVDMIFGDRHVSRGGDLYLSEQQLQIIHEIVYEDRISVVSGRGIGKSALLALVGIWFVTVWPRAKVICTAPGKPQLMSALWPEYRKWITGTPLQPLFEMTATKIYLKEDQLCFIEPRTASKDKPESMSGLHEDSLLIQVDEGSRVDDVVFRTIDDTLTGINNKLLTTSNGTRNIGWFYDSHTKDKSEWRTFQFSSANSPFTSQRKIDAAINKWGEDHNIVRVSYLGLFPKADPDAFIGLDRVLDAVDREIVTKDTDVIEIGVDPAREGDDLTAMVWRIGNEIQIPWYKDVTLGPEVEQMLYDLVDHIREVTGRQDKIKVKLDATGVGGYAADYAAQDREHNIDVIPVNFAGGGDDRYANMPTRIWGAIEQAIDQLSIPDPEAHKEDEKAHNALERLVSEVGARKADFNIGKTRIQPKNLFKKDIGFSPDFADALGLCLFEARNPRSVLKAFDDQSKKVVLERLNYTNNLEKFCSVYYSRDRFASVVWCLYGDGELIITDEFTTDDNVARVSSEINFRAGQQGYKKILGNDRCFTGSPTDNMQKYYRNYKVRLQKNYRYDELGAIELLSNLTATGNLKVSKNCREAIKQLNNWSTDLKQTELEKDYGLAYALLNIVSELKDRINRKTQSIVNNNPYSQIKNEENSKLFNRGLLL